MKQATQLEIDFGPEFRTPAVVAPGASAAPAQPSVVDRAELRALDAVAKAAVRMVKAVIALPLFDIFFSALSVIAGFALMFFAAILQG